MGDIELHFSSTLDSQSYLMALIFKEKSQTFHFVKGQINK